MDTPDWVTTIWTISTTDDTRLAIDPPDGTFSRWIQKSTIFGIGTEQDITTIRTALSGLPQAVQSEFWQEYDTPSIFGEPEVTAVTTARMRTIPVWVYSPSAAWLLAATSTPGPAAQVVPPSQPAQGHTSSFRLPLIYVDIPSGWEGQMT